MNTVVYVYILNKSLIW